MCRTYQEGFLARRRIVFTPSQVYSQCLQTHTYEAFPALFESGPRCRNSPPPPQYGLQIFPPIFNEVIRRGPDAQTQVEGRIREYLCRTLSFESDILSAFLGVIRQTWYGVHKTYHFWGLPFRPTGHALGSLYSGFIASLLWSPDHKDVTRSMTRRTGFPSWTWAGWENIAGIKCLSDLCLVPEPDQRFPLELVVGGRMDVGDYVEEMERAWDIYRFCRHVYLDGWTTWVRLFGNRTDNSIIRIETVEIADILGVKFSYTTFMGASTMNNSIADIPGLTPDTWPVILFITAAGGLCGLILQIKEDDVFERLGCFSASMDSSSALGSHGDGDADAYENANHAQFRVFPMRGCQEAYQAANLECERRTIKLV